jgi:Fe-S-cluster containining protein
MSSVHALNSLKQKLWSRKAVLLSLAGMSAIMQQLAELSAMADAEFERGRDLHGSRILCAAGCSSCCSQIFQITEPEAARISAHVAELAPAERERLQAAANGYLERRQALLPDEQWGDPPPAAGIPCPALTADGSCGIYPVRPVLCRKFGVPIYNPEKPERVMACELNFAPGEAIEDPELIEQQTRLFQEQQRLQAAWNEAGGHRDAKPLNVARAIAENHADNLP